MNPIDLGAHAITALVERSGIDPGAVEDVVWGCVDSVGPQAGDVPLSMDQLLGLDVLWGVVPGLLATTAGLCGGAVRWFTRRPVEVGP